MTSTRNTPCAGILLLTALMQAGCSEPTQHRQGKDEGRVARLFESMRDNTYRATYRMSNPHLAWEHIPALLELSGSQRVLTQFPINPISSQAEETCREGMIALWLIEGIRRGGHLSMAPLCLRPGENRDWTAASEANHPAVLAAYRGWWERVRTLPQADAVKVNPLEGTGMAWH